VDAPLYSVAQHIAESLVRHEARIREVKAMPGCRDRHNKESLVLRAADCRGSVEYRGNSAIRRLLIHGWKELLPCEKPAACLRPANDKSRLKLPHCRPRESDVAITPLILRAAVTVPLVIYSE